MRSAGAIVQRNDSQPAIPVAAAIHCSNSTSTVLDLGQHSQATVKTRCLSEVHLLSSISKLKAVYKVLVYPVGTVRASRQYQNRDISGGVRNSQS